MPTLPDINLFNGSTATQGDQKTYMSNLRAFVAGLFGTAGTQTDALTTLGASLNGVLSKSAAYSIVVADRGKLIDYTTAPYTATLPTAATAGAGFVLAFRNSAASGVLTVGRNSATIDGAASDMTLNPGESSLIVCDGTAWKSVGKYIIPTAGESVAIRQIVTAEIVSATGSSVIPWDNTTPLSTEGTQIVTANITPADSNNKVRVRASFVAAFDQSGYANKGIVFAVFRGTTCIGGGLLGNDNSLVPCQVSLEFVDAPASSSAQTYSIRCGAGENTVAKVWYVGRPVTGENLGGVLDNGIMSLEELVV